MGVVVAFIYAAWISRYPEFSGVTETTANEYFAEACVYHNNTPAGLVCDAPAQRTYLNMMTAHVAARYSNGCAPAAPNTPVGRIASAGEGSVNASFDMGQQPASAAWLMQTKYGADYWNATRSYRTARYRARPTVVVDGLYAGGPYGRGCGSSY